MGEGTPKPTRGDIGPTYKRGWVCPRGSYVVITTETPYEEYKHTTLSLILIQLRLLVGEYFNG